LLNRYQKVTARYDHIKSSSRVRASYSDDQVVVGFTIGI
jgi:hypothetical protein